MSYGKIYYNRKFMLLSTCIDKFIMNFIKSMESNELKIEYPNINKFKEEVGEL